jgi:hypothetical protein
MEKVENKVEDLKEAVKIDCFTRISMYIRNMINCFCESSCNKIVPKN